MGGLTKKNLTNLLKFMEKQKNEWIKLTELHKRDTISLDDRFNVNGTSCMIFFIY